MPKPNLPYYPNILLIAGAGRNAGKTKLACSIIKSVSKYRDVTAIKISPHFHQINKDQNILVQTSEFVIIEEKLQTEKDSSKMLQAGAKKVFYIQVKQSHLDLAFNFILPYIKKGSIICESGGLNEIIRPGLFLFVHKNKEIPENKIGILKYDSIIIDLFSPDNEFDVNNIDFDDNKFSYKNEI